MNILQVISSSRTSGAEKHMVVLSEWLRHRGHNVLAVCPPGGWLPEQLREAGVPSLEMPMRGLTSTGTVLALKRIAREHQADVIHTHLTRAAYMGYFAGALSRVPVVSSVHVLTHDFAYRHLPGRNHWFVTVSDYLRQTIIAKGISPRRVHTVYNGTEFSTEPLSVLPDVTDSLHPLSVRAELALPADAELIGLFGRVDPFKGHPLLVSAAKRIVEKRPRAYFLFVGHAEPHIQQSLWEQARADGMEDRLRFTGVRNDVARLMDAVDVAAVPSEFETFGMVIIEAMARGKPVVATRIGGIPELIEDGATGFLVERTPEAFADALASLLSSPARRLAMGNAGRERARSLFSAQAMAQNMEEVYRQMLQERSLRAGHAPESSLPRA